MTTAILTWHPTYAFFHNPYEAGAFDIDLDRFARAIKGKLTPKPTCLSIKPKVRHLKRLLAETSGFIDMDIETGPATPEKPWTGKDPTQAKLRCIGFANRHHGISYWWQGNGNHFERYVLRLCADPRVVKTFHNGHWFDLRVLGRYGFRFENVFDTRDARRALSSTSPLKLSYLASLYDDAHPWKEDESDDEKGLVFTKSRRKLKIYNSYDCSYTARVREGIQAEPEWNSPRVQALYKQHTELAIIAAEMNTHGIRIDKTMRKWLAWAALEEFREKEKLLNEKVGFQMGVNPNNLRALIYKRHAVGKYAKFARFNLPNPLDPAMYTQEKDPDSALSVDEDALTLMIIDPDTPKELRDIIELYWDAATVRKGRSTFVTSERVEQAIGPDGYIRAGWNSCGTDTGRFTCSSPNIMQVPKLYRAMYVASPGCVIIGADWSQLELRVRVVVMGDHVLANDLATGDVYSANAIAWFGLPPGTNVKKENKKARQACKTIHLASQYAAGTKTVYQTALKQADNAEARRAITWPLASGLHNGFKRHYAPSVEFWHSNHAIVCERLYSETLLMKRRRYYPRPPPITETANYDTQGTAADIKNTVMIRVYHRLKKHVPDAKLIIDWHDAMYIDTPKRKERVVREIMQEEMERPVVLKGKQWVFPIEIDAGYRLSEA